MKTITLRLEVSCQNRAEPDEVAEALCALLETALSTPGVTDRVGPVEVLSLEEWNP